MNAQLNNYFNGVASKTRKRSYGQGKCQVYMKVKDKGKSAEMKFTF